MIRNGIGIGIGITLALLSSCVHQARQVVAPEPDGTGVLSCREIVEQCDSTCSDPFCLAQCSNQGTPEGAAQHQALLDCGQRSGCTDQACMEASCPGEIGACMGGPPPGEEAPPMDAPPDTPMDTPPGGMQPADPAEPLPPEPGT